MAIKSALFQKNTELEKVSVESIADKMDLIGEVGIIAVNELPIAFDLRMGEVTSVTVKVGSNLFNEVSVDNTNILFLAKEAITLIAKRELLLQLLSVPDEKVKNLVRDRHIVNEQLDRLTKIEVDRTLIEIQKLGGKTLFSTPSVSQIKIAVAIGEIDKVNSLNKVDEIMLRISGNAVSRNLKNE